LRPPPLPPAGGPLLPPPLPKREKERGVEGGREGAYVGWKRELKKSSKAELGAAASYLEIISSVLFFDF